MSESSLVYDFVAPSRIVFGCGRRREVGLLARSLGRRAFLVCGSRTLELNGELAALISSLQSAGVEAVRAGGISREPLVEDVDALVTQWRALSPGPGDLVVGVGGGSAIDLAKAAAALVVQREFVTVKDYLEGVGRGLKIVETPLPVLAMPTTGGTGTEATKNAVISSLDPPFKKSLRSELMVPRIALVDPELAVTLPPHITAWTGMDAITQLIESFVSKRATHATRQIAAEALQPAMRAVKDAFLDGASLPAREIMAQSALCSGIALANSGLGMAHGVAAALGVHCNVPHGLACAVMLPIALRTNALVLETDARAAFLAMTVSSDVPRVIGGSYKRSYNSFVALVEALLDDLKIPRRLSEIGVTREQIPALVRDSRGNSMSGNPRDLSDEELTDILEANL